MGDLEKLQALHFKDRSIDAAEHYSTRAGWRPLIIAAAEGRTDAVKLLLNKGANPNVTNAKGRTALMFAAHYGFARIVDALLDAGADPDLVPANGGKAIVAAGRAGKVEPIVSILKKGGSISAADCEPDDEDACVLIGMVLGGVLMDYTRAKAINEPLCLKANRLACGIVVAQDCFTAMNERKNTDSVARCFRIFACGHAENECATAQCLPQSAHEYNKGLSREEAWTVMRCLEEAMAPVIKARAEIRKAANASETASVPATAAPR